MIRKCDRKGCRKQIVGGRPDKRFCSKRCCHRDYMDRFQAKYGVNYTTAMDRNLKLTPKKIKDVDEDISAEALEKLISSRLATMPEEPLPEDDRYESRQYETLPPTRFMRFSKRWRGQFIF